QHIPNPAFDPNLPIGPDNRTTVSNSPSQAAVDEIFSELPPGTIPRDLATGARFRLNRDGTIFTGLADPSNLAPGSYRFNGPVYNHPTNPQSGDLDGDLQGLPVFVMQPNGQIKENNLYSWASTPLERLSAFASGHFDVSD